MSQFSGDIIKFNAMYGMPVSEVPTLISAQRLKDFKSILAKELNEIDEIIIKMEAIEEGMANDYAPTEEQVTDVQVSLTDLFGDLQVYCASEMVKWGLPLELTLQIIMMSNFSKMGADGKPIYDEQGKLQKGPNYWKPEPRLKLMLEAVAVGCRAIQLNDQANALMDKALED